MNTFPFVSDRFGRRTSMLVYWLVIAAGVAAESGARDWKIWVSPLVRWSTLTGSDRCQGFLGLWGRSHAILASGLYLRARPNSPNQGHPSFLLQLMVRLPTKGRGRH